MSSAVDDYDTQCTFWRSLAGEENKHFYRCIWLTIWKYVTN